jgi:formylmethanofuran dehydrogenase subunit E
MNTDYHSAPAAVVCSDCGNYVVGKSYISIEDKSITCAPCLEPYIFESDLKIYYREYKD